MGSDAIQNIVVGDKVIEIELAPGETRKITESLETNDRVTIIVVTTTSSEQ